MDDVKWMKEAIKQAKKAESYDEVPIGCVKLLLVDIISVRLYNKALHTQKLWQFKKHVRN